MRPIMMLGVALIILGVAGLVFGGFSYTSREKVVDVGSLHVTAETRKDVPIPLIVGGVVLAGGVAVVAVGSRKQA
jgi:hypothetical protein